MATPRKTPAKPRIAAPRKPKAPRRMRGTGAAFVYDSLKGLILDLELEPGTLLDETQVSRQFGVSRSPVREALIRLSAEGLVQNLRNRTSMVAPFDVAALPAYFDAVQLLYRLSARLGARAVTRRALVEAHLPELAETAAPATLGEARTRGEGRRHCERSEAIQEPRK